MSYLDELKEQYKESADEANEKIEQFILNTIHHNAQQGSTVITILQDRCKAEGLYLEGVKNFLEERDISVTKQDKPIGIFFTL